MIRLNYVIVADMGIIMASWLAFGIVMLSRPKPPGTTTAAGTAQRDRRSLLGIVLQMVAYYLVWSPPHFGFARLVGAMNSQWTLPVFAWIVAIAGLMISGITLARAAIYTLGQQWTLIAQTADGHRLVTSGPYARVRHPIYTAMLLLLIGTGLALSHPVRLMIAVAVFAIGTAQRVTLEERLLDRSHDSDFRAYRERVGAIVPRFW